jgi:hypothetical protein
MAFRTLPKRIAYLLACALTHFLISNCAPAAARISLTHDPLPNPPEKRHGIVVLERFTDERPPFRCGNFVGNKRNSYGAIIGYIALDGASIDSVWTGLVGDALQHIGYTVVYSTTAASTTAEKATAPVMTGQISECWVDMYMVANAQIKIGLNLLTPDIKDTLWKANISGGKVNLVWIGLNSEYENVYKGAINYALDSAQEKFYSEEFAKKLNR